MLYKWTTTLCSKGKPMTAPVIVPKAKYFYDEMKITDNCTFSEARLQSDK